MRPKPRDSSRPKIFQSPAAAAAAASVTAAYALAKTEKLDFSMIEGVSNGRHQNHSQPNGAIELKAIREEKAKLELTLSEVQSENSKLKQEIDEVNSTHAELSKV